VDLFNQIRKNFVIFVHFKDFNISQKPKSSPLSYFAQKTSLNLAPKSDNFYVFVPEWFLFLYFKYWYFRSLKRFWDCDFKFVNVLELHQSMINDVNNRVLIWRFTLVLIKINYGQIGDQTGLFYTTNPVFYTSGNIFVCRTGTYGNLIFSLVPSDNCNTRSTCPTSVFTGTGQTLMSRPACNFEVNLITHLEVIALFSSNI
jgi:hypothetical protein